MQGRLRSIVIALAAVALVGLDMVACGDDPGNGDSGGTVGGGECPDGETLCGAACFDLEDDEEHCGSCGYACADGVPCVAGVCGGECPQSHVLCGNGNCVDVSSDPEHCGE